MSVILAHAGVQAVGGGFLGVDVFFVISGYLITTILKKDLEEGRYTLAAFYERRARRILPALLLVIGCSLPFAFWLMLPDFLQNFGQSVVATLLFANNLLLARTSGYWELESNFKPLLHTWSLGVEEQFYLAFPIFLALLWRFGARVQITAILLVGLASFAISEHGWRTYPDVSFYLPTSRAWELMAGCAAAYVTRKPRAFDNFVSLLALLAIVLPMFLFDEHIPSPSYYSALPVLGAVGVLLFSWPGTIAYRLLSLRPMVVIGLISYSAYLWHQPLFAFARVASLTPPEPLEMAGLTLATLALAWLSWRFVEQPFRDRKFMPLRLFIPITAALTALFVAIGLVLHVKEGFPRWTYPNIASAGEVYISYNERVRRYTTDQFPGNGKPNVLLLGDSYGRDVGNILLEGKALEGKNLIYLQHYPACGSEDAFDPAVLKSLYAEADLIVVALHTQGPGCVEKMDAQFAGIMNARIIYFGSKDFGYNINPFGRIPMEDRAEAFASLPEQEQEYNDALAAKLPAERYVDLVRLLGPDGKRLHFFDGQGNPLTPDRKHLTRYGALFVAEKIRAENPPAWQAIVEAERKAR